MRATLKGSALSVFCVSALLMALSLWAHDRHRESMAEVEATKIGFGIERDGQLWEFVSCESTGQLKVIVEQPESSQYRQTLTFTQPGENLRWLDFKVSPGNRVLVLRDGNAELDQHSSPRSRHWIYGPSALEQYHLASIDQGGKPSDMVLPLVTPEEAVFSSNSDDDGYDSQLLFRIERIDDYEKLLSAQAQKRFWHQMETEGWERSERARSFGKIEFPTDLPILKYEGDDDVGTIVYKPSSGHVLMSYGRWD